MRACFQNISITRLICPNIGVGGLLGTLFLFLATFEAFKLHKKQSLRNLESVPRASESSDINHISLARNHLAETALERVGADRRGPSPAVHCLLLKTIKKSKLQIEGFEGTQHPDRHLFILSVTGQYASIHDWLKSLIEIFELYPPLLSVLEVQSIENHSRIRAHLQIAYPLS